MKKIILALMLLSLMLTGCGNKVTTTSDDSSSDDIQSQTQQEQVQAPGFSVPDDSEITDKIQIEMEDGSVMTLGLFSEYAPKTVENFLKLAGEGFYDGLTFHRVISGFMIQGGDPQGTGMGGSDEDIPGEFISNGFDKNTIAHERGVISMARSSDPDSASSQFFIMHQTSPHLDGQYAAFGKVLEGIEAVDKIAAVETGANDKPVTPVVIKSIKVIE